MYVTEMRRLCISLQHDRDISIKWSPKLHMLAHHEACEIVAIFKRCTANSSSDTASNKHQSSNGNKTDSVRGQKTGLILSYLP